MTGGDPQSTPEPAAQVENSPTAMENHHDLGQGVQKQEDVVNQATSKLQHLREELAAQLSKDLMEMIEHYVVPKLACSVPSAGFNRM